MKKRIMGICLAVCIMLCMVFAASAYEIPASAKAVTVEKAGGRYTVSISNSVYANADVSVMAIANGYTVSEAVSSSKVAYFGEKKADGNGEAKFSFVPGDNFDETSFYILVSVKSGVKTYKTVAVNKDAAAPVIFNRKILAEAFDERFPDTMTEASLNAKYAAAVFARGQVLTNEVGIIYSASNSNPSAYGDDCMVKAAASVGENGSYGIYLYSTEENENTYYFRTYIRSGNNYSYGDVQTFTLSKTEGGDE